MEILLVNDQPKTEEALYLQRLCWKIVIETEETAKKLVNISEERMKVNTRLQAWIPTEDEAKRILAAIKQQIAERHFCQYMSSPEVDKKWSEYIKELVEISTLEVLKQYVPDLNFNSIINRKDIAALIGAVYIITRKLFIDIVINGHVVKKISREKIYKIVVPHMEKIIINILKSNLNCEIIKIKLIEERPQRFKCLEFTAFCNGSRIEEVLPLIKRRKGLHCKSNRYTDAEN